MTKVIGRGALALIEEPVIVTAFDHDDIARACGVLRVVTDDLQAARDSANCCCALMHHAKFDAGRVYLDHAIARLTRVADGRAEAAGLLLGVHERFIEYATAAVFKQRGKAL